MAILGELEAHGPSLAGELISALGLPKSSTYTLLDAMKQHKLITQDSQGRYRLWLRLLALGQAASASLDRRDVARRHLLRLMEDIVYPDSAGKTFYAIVDGSYLYLDTDARREEICGEAFVIENGALTPLSAAGGVVPLT